MEGRNLEKKTEINNLHFLVHPGFIHRFHHGLDRGSFSGEEGVALLDKYVEQAKALGGQEVMILFTPTSPWMFSQDVRKTSNPDKYALAIREIKKNLGDRLIVIADQGDIMINDDSSDRERVWSRIKKILEKRGFILSNQLTAEAYGEYWNHCVSAIAANMHLASGMADENPVAVRTKLTEFSLNPPPRRPEPKFKNVKLDLPEKDADKSF